MSTDVIYDGMSASALRSRVHFDETDGLMHVEHIGDCEPLIERNKAVFNGHGGWRSDRTGDMKGGTMRHVGTIPPVMMVKLLDMGINVYQLDDPEMDRRFRQVMNSNEFRFLRTTPGKI